MHSRRRLFVLVCERTWIACCIISGAAAVARAQTGAAPPTATEARTIAGTVFDSIAHRPLGGAHVHIADLGRDGVADSLGAFRFDSVSPGVHTVWADHPALDRLGLLQVRASVDATSQLVTSVTLAVPSFATLWQRACNGVPVPQGEVGLVYGQVGTGAAATSVGAATVTIAWHMSASDGSHTPANETRIPARVGATGSYAICGVPTRQTLTLSAGGLGTTTTPVSFQIGAERITRRDLTIPTLAMIEHVVADSSSVTPLSHQEGATLTGTARDSTGQPLSEARVVMSGVSGEWRTTSSGAFVVQGIPPGSHVLAITAVGFMPERRLVDLAFTDSAGVDLSMTRLLTTLKTVKVLGRERFVAAIKSELDQRRRAGFGYMTDSTALSKLPGLMEAFNFPDVRTTGTPSNWGIRMTGVYEAPSGVTTGTMGRNTTAGSARTGVQSGPQIALSCNPTVWVDGAKADMTLVNAISKDEVALIEVYNSAARAPLQYTGSGTCGVVLVWTKLYLSP